MIIEITMVDIICRIIAAVSIILCIILYFYDRHITAKWIKENLKDKKEVKNNEINQISSEKIFKKTPRMDSEHNIG